MITTAELSGKLEFLSLADLLQLIGGNGSTGVLRIRSRYAPSPGVIYFANGNPVDASTGESVGLDALYSLFGWKDGDFEFRRERFSKRKAISQSRMEIILDGLRMLDDGKIKPLGQDTGDPEDPHRAQIDGLPVVKGPMVDYMYVVDEESFVDGQEIIVEGKHGTWVWVVLEGIIEVMKNSPHGQRKIVNIGEGGFVGSVASFLVGGSHRTASVRALGNVQLGVLDSQRLAIEFAKMSGDAKATILSLDRRLKEVNESLVAIQTRSLNVASYVRDKKPVIQQGQAEDRLFRITQGEVCVVRQANYGNVPLARLGRDGIFGSFSFLPLGHEPETAAVFGTGDLKVSRIDPDVLEEEFEVLPATFRNIIDHLGSCISVTTNIACHAFSQQ